MIKLNKDFLVRILILLGVVFSFFIFVSVENKSGSLSFTFHPYINFSLIDISIDKSLETKHYSNFLGILFYLIASLLIITNLKRFFLIQYFTLFLLFILLLSDIYFIYLVKQGEFVGQHLRLTIPIFLLILYCYRKNKNTH